MCHQLIHSVGIDIGTTTTQVIFSELELINRASVSQIPHYEFSRRDITYVSPVIFTPIESDGSVSQKQLEGFIKAQYEKAGLNLNAVETGAIIITGETSKARNARDTIMELAGLLGDFVVATAGPHLESIIAGRGSGASEYAKEHACRVLNIDIGGGTSNYAVFEAGRVIDTACLNVGGHLIETHKDGKIKTIREPAKIIIQACLGDQVDLTALNSSQLNVVMDCMAKLIIEVIEGEPSALANTLLMTQCLRPDQHFDQIFISGGVGDCYYQQEPVTEPFIYGDVGPLLAVALKKQTSLTQLTQHRPKQTVRATVIGAGAYTLSLSGSTIWLNADKLPYKNVPVVQSTIQDENANSSELVQSWVLSLNRMDLDPLQDLYALAIPTVFSVSYKNVVLVANALNEFNKRYPNTLYPLIVIAKQDMGKVLGMELQPYLEQRELAVIDEVETQDGDYVDIGKPFFGGEIVPLTVKSLAFPS